jgi:hypothetical protein
VIQRNPQFGNREIPVRMRDGDEARDRQRYLREVVRSPDAEVVRVERRFVTPWEVQS